MEGTVAQSIQVMSQDLIRLDRFDGGNFTRWQEKVMFFLTSLKLAYILDDNLEQIPEPTPEDTEEIRQKRVKRKEDEFMCRGHILNSFYFFSLSLLIVILVVGDCLYCTNVPSVLVGLFTDFGFLVSLS